MAKTEDIEAKLAAYVDGEIDQAGRAEIEKHLASNPQHRVLIKELMQQREQLRSLPREVAPMEVSETVNAQLERAVLLGDVEGDVDTATMQLHRWPQFRAIAAILIFTASLASVIYYLLPSPNQKPQLAADLRPGMSTTAPSESTGTTLAGHATNGVIAMSTLPSPVSVRQEAFASPTTATSIVIATTPESAAATDQQRRAALALRNDTLGDRGGAVSVEDPLAPSPRLGSVSNTLPPSVGMFQTMLEEKTVPPASALPIGQTTQVLWIVEAADPQATSREMTRYLSSANISWEAGAEPNAAPMDVQQGQLAMGSRLQSQTVQLKTGPATNPSSAEAKDEAGKTVALAQPTTTPSDAVAMADQSPTTAPSDVAVAAGAGSATGIAAQNRAPLTPVVFGRQIFVKRVSRMQAAQIRLALEEIRTKSPGSDANSALTMSSNAPITSVGLNGFPSAVAFTDDRLRELSKANAAVPTTRPVAMEESTGSLSYTSPTTAPTASVELPAPPTGGTARTVPPSAMPKSDPNGVNFSLAPSTAPSVDFKSPTTSESVTSSTASQAPVLTIAPATQPAGEVFDVVILIQPQATAVPATAPATQPQ